MSTTYFMVVNEKDVEIARTHFNGEQVELTWLNPLADLLVDEEVLMSDSGNQLYETVGDLRALEVPSDAEVMDVSVKMYSLGVEDAFYYGCTRDDEEINTNPHYKLGYDFGITLYCETINEEEI